MHFIKKVLHSFTDNLSTEVERPMTTGHIVARAGFALTRASCFDGRVFQCTSSTWTLGLAWSLSVLWVANDLDEIQRGEKLSCDSGTKRNICRKLERSGSSGNTAGACCT
jgi:hypothetical protein